jgi:ABC-2 type transport system permease protein
LPLKSHPVTTKTLQSPAQQISRTTPAARPGLLLPALSLARRELVRFLRQRNRIIGALATPLIFWLLIGGGMGRSLNFAGMTGDSYIRYFFPGTLVMILLFTAIFSTISIIEDRREGFLQSVLVAPVPRSAVVLGKVLGGTILATGQGFLFLLLAPLVGFRYTPASFVLALLLMLVLAFALTALGFCLAWRMTSTQGFHAVMNLFLMPMWFLSGALFPPDGAWAGLKYVMLLNPLTYGLAGLRRILSLPASTATDIPGPGLATSLIVSVVFAVLLYWCAGAIARRPSTADLH